MAPKHANSRVLCLPSFPAMTTNIRSVTVMELRTKVMITVMGMALMMVVILMMRAAEYHIDKDGTRDGDDKDGGY